MLTPRQRAAYDFIETFGAERGYAPSYDEIRRHLGLASLNAVAKLIAQLRRRGQLVAAPPNAKRWLEPVRRRRGVPAGLAARVGPAPRTTATTIPLLGTIAAGRPIETIEHAEEIEVPASMLGAGERYALRVQGDSMIEDGIRDGDLVLVRRAVEAENGATVIAVLEGEATLKRFFRRGARVELRPANAALQSIHVPASRVEIRGVLIGLLRRYS